MSKLSDFLKKEKIDNRRLIATSKQLEALRPEDRVVIITKRNAKPGEGAAKAAAPAEGEAAAKPAKRRSGRPVAGPTLDYAIKGEAISGAAKTRITRAVNAILVAKKKKEVTFRDLF